MTPTHTQPIQATLAMAGSRRRLALGVAISLLVVLGAAVAVSFTRARRPVAIADHRQLTFTGDAWQAEISPDGKWLAYVSGDSVLQVREISGGRAVTVLRGRYPRQPVWSPDGGSLMVGVGLEGDMAHDAVWEVPRLGGEPRRVGSNASAYAYSPDGRTIAWMVTDTLFITDRETGREVHRRVVSGVVWTLLLRWSPDGRWLAVAGLTTEWGIATFLIDSAGQTRHLIRRGATSPAWNEDGTALYVLSGQEIIRHQFDRRTGMPRDSGVTVLSGQTGANDFSLARDGRTLVLTRGPMSHRIVSVTVPVSGNLGGAEAVPLSSGTGTVGFPSVSPDGRWVAWTERAGASRSVRLSPFGGGASRILARYEGSAVSRLRWAPDSRHLAYFAGDSSQHSLYIATPDGAEPRRVSPMPAGTPMPGVARDNWAWARQGLIVPDSGGRGWLLVDPSSGSARPLASNDSLTGLYAPLLSPDGETLIASHFMPFGFWNNIYQRGVGAGSSGWAKVPYDGPGDANLVRWDATGLYAAVNSQAFGIVASRWEMWRTRSPGEPFKPVLTGLKWCTWSLPSLSDDNRHLACDDVTITSDVWLVTGFDGEGR